MKKLLFGCAAAVLLAGAGLAALLWFAGGSPAGDAPKWENPTAVNPAAPTMLELGAEFCPPCRKMKRELLTLRERCGARLNLLYHDLEKAENRPLARQYEVRAIPVQVFLAPDGRELFRHVGFFPAARIVAKWRELGYAVDQE